ncbi:MAG: HAD family hydrolase [Ilumatobacteraceae bacterium]
MERPAAVFWDMDGTLVDTEPYWSECEHELIHAHGGTWTEADALSLVGFDLRDAAAEIRDRGGVDLEPAEIVDILLDGVVRRVAEHLPWRPGARELLTACRDAEVPCVLVTMSWRRLAEAMLDAAPTGSFTAAVTGDEVTHGKPHPEPYAKAAADLGVDPGDCVAIEDSPTGVTSALAAGCATLGVPHKVPLPPADGLTLVDSLVGMDVDDLARLVPR